MQKGHMKTWRFELRSLNSQKGREKVDFLIYRFADEIQQNQPSPPQKNTTLLYVSKADSISRLARSPLGKYYPTPITRTVPRLRSASLQ